MADVTIEISIDVRCDECNADLEAEFVNLTYYHKQPQITVKPCEKCLEAAKQEGREEALRRSET
jgi:hypothetical protein